MIPALVILAAISTWAVIRAVTRGRRGDRAAASPLATAAAVVMLLASVGGSVSALLPVMRSASAGLPPRLEQSAADLIERLAAETDARRAVPVLMELGELLELETLSAEERSRLIGLLTERLTGKEPRSAEAAWAGLAVIAWERGWLPAGAPAADLIGAVARVGWNGLEPMTAGEVSLVPELELPSAGAVGVRGEERVIRFDVRLAGVELDGVQLARNSGSGVLTGEMSSSGISSSGGAAQRFEAPVPPGRYVVTVELSTTMTLVPADAIGGASDDGVGVPVRWEERRRVEVEVLERPPDWSIPVDDDETRAAIMSGAIITDGNWRAPLRELRVQPYRGGWVVRGSLQFASTSVGLEGAVIVRANGREAPGFRGVFVRPDEPRFASFGFRAEMDQRPEPPFDVIFRPAPTAAQWRDHYYDLGPVPLLTEPLVWADLPFRVETLEYSWGEGAP